MKDSIQIVQVHIDGLDTVIAVIILFAFLSIAFLLGRIVERRKSSKEKDELNKGWAKFSKNLVNDLTNKSSI